MYLRLGWYMNIMNLEEVCSLLKINVTTGRNRLCQGKAMPPSFKVGRRRLFREDDVIAWLNSIAPEQETIASQVIVANQTAF